MQIFGEIFAEKNRALNCLPSCQQDFLEREEEK